MYNIYLLIKSVVAAVGEIFTLIAVAELLSNPARSFSALFPVVQHIPQEPWLYHSIVLLITIGMATAARFSRYPLNALFLQRRIVVYWVDTLRIAFWASLVLLVTRQISLATPMNIRWVILYMGIFAILLKNECKDGYPEPLSEYRLENLGKLSGCLLVSILEAFCDW
ncbi:hypothetical protein [Pseudodesulfovibrio sp.]|uniref:hypothetical protein n=1 Tax=unclassified Pseudodesulfovibrio TaxID=2661612 RepID=UPI003B00EB29